MLGRITALLAALCLLGASPPRGKMMLLPEMLKHMESSPIEYKMASLADLRDVSADDFGKLLYPQRVSPADLPQTSVKNGRRVVGEAPCDAARPLIKQAEAIFQTKHYDAAAALYDEAMEKAPRCYLALAYRGDAAFFAGDVKKALTYYDRAIAMNPDDGAIYVFRANAYQRLGRDADELRDLRTSLALRPHAKIVLDIVAKNAARLHVELRDVPFVPASFARAEGKGFAIYSDPARPAWLAYAACKALWLAEPEHRERLTGHPEPGFSSDEEKECLGALIVGYDTFRHDGKQPADPQLEYLEQVVASGDASPWIVYELGARVNPQIVLTLGAEQRRGMIDFVRRHVIVDLK